jgi:hypothetical protein
VIIPEYLDPERDPGAAARDWLANTWYRSEFNYIADFNVSPELRDAIEEALIHSFHAGSEWREKHPDLPPGDVSVR